MIVTDDERTELVRFLFFFCRLNKAKTYLLKIDYTEPSGERFKFYSHYKTLEDAKKAYNLAFEQLKLYNPDMVNSMLEEAINKVGNKEET